MITAESDSDAREQWAELSVGAWHAGFGDDLDAFALWRSGELWPTEDDCCACPAPLEAPKRIVQSPASAPTAAPIAVVRPIDPIAEALAAPIADRVASRVAELVVRPRYYAAANAPIERRAWNRALRELPSFKPGREVLVRADDLHAWIERHPARSVQPTQPEPLSYEAFAAGVRKRRADRGG